MVLSHLTRPASSNKTSIAILEFEQVKIRAAACRRCINSAVQAGPGRCGSSTNLERTSRNVQTLNDNFFASRGETHSDRTRSFCLANNYVHRNSGIRTGQNYLGQRLLNQEEQYINSAVQAPSQTDMKTTKEKSRKEYPGMASKLSNDRASLDELWQTARQAASPMDIGPRSARLLRAWIVIGVKRMEMEGRLSPENLAIAENNLKRLYS